MTTTLNEGEKRRNGGLKKGQQRVTKVKGKTGRFKGEEKNGDLNEKGRSHIVQVLVLMYVCLSVLGHRPVSLITP